MARKTAEETNWTYRQLLESALEMFRRQGVASTTMEQIARNADVTRGAVYWHFDNKESIVIALWEAYVFPRARRLETALAHLDPERPTEHFREILIGEFQEILTQRELGLAMGILLRAVELQRVSRDERRKLHEAVAAALSQLREGGYVASELPAELLAASLMSYLHGLLDLSLSLDSPVSVRGDIHRLLDLLLDGMLRPESQRAAAVASGAA